MLGAVLIVLPCPAGRLSSLSARRAGGAQGGEIRRAELGRFRRASSARRVCCGPGRVQGPVDRGPGHPEPGHQLPDRLPTSPQRPDLPHLRAGQLRRPAPYAGPVPARLPARPRPARASAPAHTPPAPRRSPPASGPWPWSSRCPPAATATAPRPGQPLHRADHPGEGPAQPVQGDHHDGVARPDVSEQLHQPRPVLPHPGQPVGEHPPAPRPGQRVLLSHQRLVIGAHPRIPHHHHPTASQNSAHPPPPKRRLSDRVPRHGHQRRPPRPASHHRPSHFQGSETLCFRCCPTCWASPRCGSAGHRHGRATGVGAIVARFTRRPVVVSALRQLALGALAAGVTYLVG